MMASADDFDKPHIQRAVHDWLEIVMMPAFRTQMNDVGPSRPDVMEESLPQPRDLDKDMEVLGKVIDYANTPSSLKLYESCYICVLETRLPRYHNRSAFALGVQVLTALVDCLNRYARLANHADTYWRNLPYYYNSSDEHNPAPNVFQRSEWRLLDAKAFRSEGVIVIEPVQPHFVDEWAPGIALLEHFDVVRQTHVLELNFFPHDKRHALDLYRFLLRAADADHDTHTVLLNSTFQDVRILLLSTVHPKPCRLALHKPLDADEWLAMFRIYAPECTLVSNACCDGSDPKYAYLHEQCMQHPGARLLHVLHAIDADSEMFAPILLSNDGTHIAFKITYTRRAIAGFAPRLRETSETRRMGLLERREYAANAVAAKR